MKRELKDFTRQEIDDMLQIISDYQKNTYKEDDSKDTTDETTPLILDNDDIRWNDLLEFDDKGHIMQSLNNCCTILEHDSLLAGAIKYNELTSGKDIVKPMPWHRISRAYADIDTDEILKYMEKFYNQRVEKNVEKATNIIANANSYHPIRDKLNSLSWDGQKRLGVVLHHFLGVNQTELETTFLRLFMLGAISRVFTPGCKFEYMLCLVGGQGAGKSSFLKYLALNPDWFSDDIKQLGDKEVYEHILGHWIVEIAEMIGILQAKSVEDTKAFLSREKDNFRIKYHKYAMDFPRQVVFAGTSNKLQFLPPDKSGNRRFLPIEVNGRCAQKHINADPEYSKYYFEQLWAEVMEIYRLGDFILTLSNEDQERLKQKQLRYSPEDPMESAIINYIEDKEPDYICTHMLYEEALGHYSFDKPEMWESNAIGEIVNNHFRDEYQKIGTHTFEKYGKQRAWVRIRDHEFKDIPPEKEKDIPFL